MKMYFSGISSAKEAQILKSLGIRDALADPIDWPNMADCGFSNVALDSGAYRAFKAGSPISNVDEWCAMIEKRVESVWSLDFESDLDFITMPDVLGDPEATWERWTYIKGKLNSTDRFWCEFRVALHMHLIPVWQWGGSENHLWSMVDWAAGNNKRVAIGGCVPWMRAKDEEALRGLVKICKQHGRHLHILGLNWLEALQEVEPYAKSCDTSKWIDGARYGEVILNEGGKLVQLHKRAAGMASASREELMTACAKTLDDYCNKGIRTETVEARPKGRVYTLKPGRKYEAKNPAKVAAQNTLNMLCSEADIRRRQLRQANLF